MGVSQPIAGYPSKTAAVADMSARGIVDFEIARRLEISVSSVAALRCSAKRRKGDQVIRLHLTDDQFNNLSRMAESENWSLTDEIKARCFNTDYLDPVDT